VGGEARNGRGCCADGERERCDIAAVSIRRVVAQRDNGGRSRRSRSGGADEDLDESTIVRKLDVLRQRQQEMRLEMLRGVSVLREGMGELREDVGQVRYGQGELQRDMQEV